MCNYCLWVLLLGREGGGGSLLAEGSRGGQSMQGFLTKLTWWLQLKQQSCPLAFFPGCPEIREHLGFPLWGKWWDQHPSNVMFLSLEHTSHCPAHSLFVLAGSPASICLGLTQGSLVKWLQWLNSLKLQELIFFLIVFAFWCSPCVQFLLAVESCKHQSQLRLNSGCAPNGKVWGGQENRAFAHWHGKLFSQLDIKNCTVSYRHSRASWRAESRLGDRGTGWIISYFSWAVLGDHVFLLCWHQFHLRLNAALLRLGYSSVYFEMPFCHQKC